MSLRPDSAMARRMFRPMRPNPLMATRTDMFFSSNVSFVMPGLVPGIPIERVRRCVPKRDGRDKPGHDRQVGALVSSSSELAQRRLGDLLRRNAEMAIKVLVRGAGAEA